MSFIGIIILIIVLLNTDFIQLFNDRDVEAIQDVLDDNLFFMLGITLVLMIIQNIFTIIPLILLLTINSILFGVLYGFIWSWLTSVVGALIAFLIVRYWLQDLFIKRMSPNVKEKIEVNGFLYLFILRLFPFIPTSILNTAAGISSIRLKHYLLATLIGNMLYQLVLYLISLGFISMEI